MATGTLSQGGVSPLRTGRRQRRNSRKGQVRRPNLSHYYRQRLRDVTPGEFWFRVVLIRPEKKGKARQLVLDRILTSLTWSDSEATLTGTLTLIRQNIEEPLPVRDQHRVRLLVRWAGRWYRLWEMRVDGDPPPSLPSGESSVALTDDLEGLRRATRDWEFKKSKARPHGWKAHQVARYVARQEGVKVGHLARGVKDITKLKAKETSGLDMIRKAYAEEGKKTGRKYVVKLRDGRLDVLPVQRGRVLYEVKGIATQIDLESRAKNRKPHTVIEATGRVKRDGKDRKVKLTVFDRDALRRFGRSTDSKSYGRVDSRKDLHDQAKEDLADELRITRTATMTIPGIPFIGRGDTVRWINREPGWHGPAKGTLDRQFAYVSSATHNVSAGEYTLDLTLRQQDPYLADARRLAERARKQKKKDKAGRKRKGSGNDGDAG